MTRARTASLRVSCRTISEQDDAGAESDDDDTADASELRVLRFASESDQFVGVNPDSASDTTELLLRIDSTSFHYLEVSLTLEVAGATEAPSTANDLLDELITARNPGRRTIIALRLTDEVGQAIPNAACRIVSGATPAEQGADPSALTADGNGVIRPKTDPAAVLCEIALGQPGATDLGENTQGAVGVGRLPSAGDIPIPDSPNEYLAPQKVVGLPPVNSVMAAGNQTCALTRAGEIFCWGETWSGKPGATAFVPNATLVSGLPTAEALTIGRPTCAVTVDGEAFCWGEGCPLSAPEARPRVVEWSSGP